MLTIKRLEDGASIEDACALLYKTLIEQGNWNFLPDNPSQLRTVVRNNRNLLIDRFTENAIWFGAFDDIRLVGCVRLTFVDENNQLEMESYKHSDVIQKYLPTDKNHCVEVTRAAVLRDRNGLGIRIRDLFLAAFQYCENNKYSICAASSNAYIIALFKKIGCPLKLEHAFKYEAHDPVPVNFYFADYTKSEVKTIVLSLQTHKKDVNPNNTKIFDFLEIVAPMLPTPVYWHDTEGVVLGLNAHCLEGIGATRDIIGKTPYEFYPKEVAKHILEHNERVMQTGETLSQDEQIKDIETGEIKIFRSIKSPLYNDEGKIIGIIGSSIDVTKERQAEVLKTQFIQNMQHDIRTPAVGMFGILSQLAEKKTDPEENALFGMLAKASENLLNLCNDVVAFGDVENNVPIAETMVNIRQIAENVLDLNKPAAFGKNLVLKLKVDREIPLRVFLDEFRLQRILLNLVGNAIKFTEKGHIAVHIIGRINDARHGAVGIEVSDTGIGIPSDKKRVIFDKFTRLTPSNTNRYPGTGLGLYVVKKFVEDLQGDFSVASTVGKGSCFTVMLPFRIPLLETTKQPEIIEEEYHSPLTHLKESAVEITATHEKPTVVQLTIDNFTCPFNHNVLVIEDSEVCLLMQKNILEPLVKYIDTAANVAEASDKLTKNNYDLVISDLGLPDGNGMDIVSIIKANPNLRNHNTPFIGLTAHLDLETHEKALTAGFLEVDTKPLEKERAYTFFEKYPVMNAAAAKVTINDLPIIDLTLAMKRINAIEPDNALYLLKVFVNTFDDEMAMLKESQQQEDIGVIRDILHRAQGGFAYLGIPRLERAWSELNSAIKATADVKKVAHFFDVVYKEAQLFQEEYSTGKFNAQPIKFKEPGADIAITKSERLAAPVPETNEPKPLFAHKVLLIEDDNVCLLMGKTFLLCYIRGDNLDTAVNVAEAKDKLAKNDYDLVISDLGLPDGNGIDIVSSIKANSAGKNYHTPFVALTAHQDAKMHQKAIAAGFSEIAVKPFTKERACTFFKKYPVIDVIAPKVAIDDLPIIDVALGMKRIGATEPKIALEMLKTFADTLDQDIIPLKEAQAQEDIKAIHDVLHKMRGGFPYTGAPRIERACIELHHTIKTADNLKKIAGLFDIVYEEVRLFKEKYDKEFRK